MTLKGNQGSVRRLEYGWGEEVTWNKAHLEMIEKNQWSEHHQIPSWLMFFCKIFSEWREQQRYGKMQEFLWETWVWGAGLPWNDRLISRENHLKQRDPWPAWIVSSSHQSYLFSFSGGLQFCGTKQLQAPNGFRPVILVVSAPRRSSCLGQHLLVDSLPGENPCDSFRDTKTMRRWKHLGLSFHRPKSWSTLW